MTIILFCWNIYSVSKKRNKQKYHIELKKKYILIQVT